MEPSKKIVKISDGIVTIEGIYDVPLLEFFKERFSEVAPDSYLTEQVILSHDGVDIAVDKNKFIRILPLYWEKFVNEIDPPVFTKTGYEAAALHEVYVQWSKNRSAALALCELKNGKTTYPDLENLAPYLKYHPLIQQVAAEAVFADKVPKRRGARKHGTIQPANVQTLIQWVVMYRAKDNSTIENAVEKALENHANLAPPEWKEPQEALEKAVKKYLQHTKK